MSKVIDKIITYSFCDSYIERLVDHLVGNHLKSGRDLSRLCLVFGGKRPALFVKQALAKRIGSNFYPPQFLTIDEFIRSILQKYEHFHSSIDLDLSYLIYKIAKEQTPQILRGRESFAAFLPWTKEIVNFIDQLDLEHVPNNSLRHIKSHAEIGYPVPDDINHLLEHIVILREAYHQKLKEQKIYSRGMQYLRAAEIVDHVSLNEFDHIIFCNFFYFNRSEEIIVKKLYERNQASFIFQGDQRKWPVLDRISRKFDCQILEGEEPDPTQFKLHLYAGFDVHSQIGLVREILKKIDNINNTVVVVPNADFVVPLMSEISQVVKDFNISMGYPLKRSSLYTLFQFIFQAQVSRKEGRYYAKDYLKVLRHPFIKNLNLSGHPTITRILIHKIEEILTGQEKTSLLGSLFINLEDIESLDELYMLTLEMADRLHIKISRDEIFKILEEIHEVFFIQWESVQTFGRLSKILKTLLDVLIHKSFMRNYPLNLNIAFHILQMNEEFESAQFQNEAFLQEELFRIFENKLSSEFISFKGSPLKGLQILGLFETRSLNFENVIVLNVNEGDLPHLNIYEPLIPREVMLSLNLDRLELEEEIQRYQFMRLISSAKNVHLVYQESKDKEKSRFIQELLWEEEKKRKIIDVVTLTRAAFKVNVSTQKVEIKKTTAMTDILRRHTFSASAVNMYLRDPIEFYYNYVLGVREQEDFLDEPEARRVGTFIHELLQHAFYPFLNKKPDINQTFRQRFLAMFEKRFEETFGKGFRSDSFLLKSVILERLQRFLDNEEHNPERRVEKILHLERRFEETIQLPCGDVRFAYVVDRVDQMKDGTIMIVDYKTGGIDQMPKAIDQIQQCELTRQAILENVRSFQLPLYYHFLSHHFKGQPINAALYNLRTLKIDRFLQESAFDQQDLINQTFLKVLNHIISEILNPSVNFQSP